MSFLKISNVDVSFGSDDSKVDILSNINLEVQQNEFIAIITSQARSDTIPPAASYRGGGAIK